MKAQRTKRQAAGSREPDVQPDPVLAAIKPQPDTLVDLDALVAITARAIEVFGAQDKALRWLRTPLPALADKTPLSMLNTTSGIENVGDVLGRIEHGIW